MEEEAAAAPSLHSRSPRTAAAPSLHSRSPRTRTAPVRVVARICPGGDPAGSFQIAARVSDAANSSSASVSVIPINKEATPAGVMTPRKDHQYKLDRCYLKDDSDAHIFQNEVKYLVDAIFCGDEGNNACVVTCGSTAKTHLVMGSQNHPGLLTMAMELILDRAKPMGATISVSSYQVLQDSHVFDFLEPSDGEVLVREDADGRTHLMDLSKVGIKSIEEFEDLCCCGSDKLKNSTKVSNQSRGHLGFIIFISRFDQHDRECPVAKMHFLDLAGSIDTKQKNHGGGLAQSNAKKSLYAVMDVVQALNSNQSFIPYRKSKVTHILQDSLCKTSDAVLIACLDEVSGHDAVSTLSLASRSSQVINEQCYSLSLGKKRCSKSNVSLSVSTKNLSRSLLPSIQQQSSALQKHSQTQFNNSAVKTTRTPTANKRFEANMNSAKKPVTSFSASINMKHSSAKSIMSGRKLFLPTTNLSKEDKKVVPTAILRPKEVQTSLCMTTQAPSPIEACDDKEKAVDIESSEMQEVVPCNIKELVSSDVQQKDPICPFVQEHSSSDWPTEHADLSMTCSSDVTDESILKTPANAIQSSPKLSEQLKEISNSLKLLSTMPVSIVKQRTPADHFKLRDAEDLEACSTRIKKSVAQECLSVLNSANKEQLKSLKGIGEKRANYILELREESPEPFKEIDDITSIIGMSKKQIKMMLSEMVLDS